MRGNLHIPALKGRDKPAQGEDRAKRGTSLGFAALLCKNPGFTCLWGKVGLKGQHKTLICVDLTGQPPLMNTRNPGLRAAAIAALLTLGWFVTPFQG